jgi:orotate phosphoribosyltransferase
MEIRAQRERLNTLIRERAVRFGEFTLRSGARSSFYLDCRRVTLDAEGAYLVGSLILDRLEASNAQAVGGPAMGAIPMVGAICALSYVAGKPLSGFFVRKEAKEYGAGNLVEGNLTPGTRVVLVEDTVTTGGELMRSADAVRNLGCEVLGAFLIVDRGAGALPALLAHGIPTQSLFTLSDLGIEPNSK